MIITSPFFFMVKLFTTLYGISKLYDRHYFHIIWYILFLIDKIIDYT